MSLQALKLHMDGYRIFSIELKAPELEKAWERAFID